MSSVRSAGACLVPCSAHGMSLNFFDSCQRTLTHGAIDSSHSQDTLEKLVSKLSNLKKHHWVRPVSTLLELTPTFTQPVHFQPGPSTISSPAPYLTTPMGSRTQPASMVPSTVALAVATPTRMTHDHARAARATPLIMNPYSRLMIPYSSIYYTPYPYQPTFHYPNTPPTEYLTLPHTFRADPSGFRADS
jgi:hypothetical protein